jgi:hypothetical protein
MPVISLAQEGQESGSKETAKAVPESTSDSKDDGPLFMAEFSYLGLDDADYLLNIRGILGYSFDFGLQLGAHLTGSHLSKPSVAGQTRVNDKGETVPQEEGFLFWGVGPMLGFDIEFVEDWLGLELTAIPYFPITNDSKGCGIEAGAYGYFSFEAASKGAFDLALMFGIKFDHIDVTADQYSIKSNQMMPGGGLMLQF